MSVGQIDENTRSANHTYLGVGLLLIIGGVIAGYIIVVLPVLWATSSEPIWRDRLAAIACQPGEAVKVIMTDSEGGEGIESSAQILCLPTSGAPIDVSVRVFLIGTANMGIPALVGGLLILIAAYGNRSQSPL
jgi:hypothetical protein